MSTEGRQLELKIIEGATKMILSYYSAKSQSVKQLSGFNSRQGEKRKKIDFFYSEKMSLKGENSDTEEKTQINSKNFSEKKSQSKETEGTGSMSTPVMMLESKEIPLEKVFLEDEVKVKNFEILEYQPVKTLRTGSSDVFVRVMSDKRDIEPEIESFESPEDFCEDLEIKKYRTVNGRSPVGNYPMRFKRPQIKERIISSSRFHHSKGNKKNKKSLKTSQKTSGESKKYRTNESSNSQKNLKIPLFNSMLNNQKKSPSRKNQKKFQNLSQSVKNRSPMNARKRQKQKNENFRKESMKKANKKRFIVIEDGNIRNDEKREVIQNFGKKKNFCVMDEDNNKKNHKKRVIDERERKKAQQGVSILNRFMRNSGNGNNVKDRGVKNKGRPVVVVNEVKSRDTTVRKVFKREKRAKNEKIQIYDDNEKIDSVKQEKQKDEPEVKTLKQNKPVQKLKFVIENLEKEEPRSKTIPKEKKPIKTEQQPSDKKLTVPRTPFKIQVNSIEIEQIPEIPEKEVPTSINPQKENYQPPEEEHKINKSEQDSEIDTTSIKSGIKSIISKYESQVNSKKTINNPHEDTLNTTEYFFSDEDTSEEEEEEEDSEDDYDPNVDMESKTATSMGRTIQTFSPEKSSKVQQQRDSLLVSQGISDESNQLNKEKENVLKIPLIAKNKVRKHRGSIQSNLIVGQNLREKKRFSLTSQSLKESPVTKKITEERDNITEISAESEDEGDGKSEDIEKEEEVLGVESSTSGLLDDEDEFSGEEDFDEEPQDIEEKTSFNQNQENLELKIDEENNNQMTNSKSNEEEESEDVEVEETTEKKNLIDIIDFGNREDKQDTIYEDNHEMEEEDTTSMDLISLDHQEQRYAGELSLIKEEESVSFKTGRDYSDEAILEETDSIVREKEKEEESLLMSKIKVSVKHLSESDIQKSVVEDGRSSSERRVETVPSQKPQSEELEKEEVKSSSNHSLPTVVVIENENNEQIEKLGQEINDKNDQNELLEDNNKEKEDHQESPPININTPEKQITISKNSSHSSHTDKEEEGPISGGEDYGEKSPRSFIETPIKAQEEISELSTNPKFKEEPFVLGFNILSRGSTEINYDVLDGLNSTEREINYQNTDRDGEINIRADITGFEEISNIESSSQKTENFEVDAEMFKKRQPEEIISGVNEFEVVEIPGIGQDEVGEESEKQKSLVEEIKEDEKSGDFIEGKEKVIEGVIEEKQLSEKEIEVVDLIEKQELLEEEVRVAEDIEQQSIEEGQKEISSVTEEKKEPILEQEKEEEVRIEEQKSIKHEEPKEEEAKEPEHPQPEKLPEEPIKEQLLPQDQKIIEESPVIKTILFGPKQTQPAKEEDSDSERLVAHSQDFQLNESEILAISKKASEFENEKSGSKIEGARSLRLKSNEEESLKQEIALEKELERKNKKKFDFRKKSLKNGEKEKLVAEKIKEKIETPELVTQSENELKKSKKDTEVIEISKEEEKEEEQPKDDDDNSSWPESSEEDPHQQKPIPTNQPSTPLKKEPEQPLNIQVPTKPQNNNQSNQSTPPTAKPLTTLPTTEIQETIPSTQGDITPITLNNPTNPKIPVEKSVRMSIFTDQIFPTPIQDNTSESWSSSPSQSPIIDKPLLKVESPQRISQVDTLGLLSPQKLGIPTLSGQERSSINTEDALRALTAQSGLSPGIGVLVQNKEILGRGSVRIDKREEEVKNGELETSFLEDDHDTYEQTEDSDSDATGSEFMSKNPDSRSESSRRSSFAFSGRGGFMRMKGVESSRRDSHRMSIVKRLDDEVSGESMSGAEEPEIEEKSKPEEKPAEISKPGEEVVPLDEPIEERETEQTEQTEQTERTYVERPPSILSSSADWSD